MQVLLGFCVGLVSGLAVLMVVVDDGRVSPGETKVAGYLFSASLVALILAIFMTR